MSVSVGTLRVFPKRSKPTYTIVTQRVCESLWTATPRMFWYKTITAHWPFFSSDDLAIFAGSVQPIFFTPKLRVKRNDDVWFLKTPIGKNTLGQMIRSIILSTPGIEPKGRTFSNKTPRRIGISRMEEAQVPIEKGMLITGHRYLFHTLFTLKILSSVLISYTFYS
jgi:hypothetical protein